MIKFSTSTARAFMSMLSVLALAACASEPAPSERETPSVEEDRTYPTSLAGGPGGSGVLAGTLWTVERLNGETFGGDAQPSLAFQGARVTVSTGCNRYFGQVSATERGITITVMGISRRGCAPQVMATERAFLDALAAIDGFALYGDDRLQLSAGPDAVIEATRSP